jgi:isoleucyl-tRNA synthetase
MLNAVIRNQVNAKEVKVIDQLPGLKIKVKPDAGKIGRTYTNISAQVLGRLTIDSPETILGHLDKESVYAFQIEGKEVKITRDMLFIEHEVPKDFMEAEFSSGHIYLNVERNEQLEAEGYSREIMRNIQQLRKQAGFEKLDRINLYLKCTPALSKNLEQFRLDIEQKVGAERLRFEMPKLALSHTGKFNIKSEQFEAWFEKV